MDKIVNTNDVLLCISYFPLFNWNSGRTVDDFIKFIEERDEDVGYVHACMWTIENDALACVFVVDRAKEIADHLNAWSEGEPDKWFTLTHGICYNNGEKGYNVTLVPELKKSRDRLISSKVLSGEISHSSQIPKETKFIFRPLGYTGPGTNYEAHRNRISGETKVFVLDSKDVEFGSTPGQEVFDKLIFLGKFKASSSEDVHL